MDAPDPDKPPIEDPQRRNGKHLLDETYLEYPSDLFAAFREDPARILELVHLLDRFYGGLDDHGLPVKSSRCRFCHPVC